MTLSDPSTGEPLAEDAIQRILFIANKVLIYQIPPLTSMKGHYASSWTDDPKRHIFTARLRLVETSSAAHLKVDVVLEDPSTGELFAAAPYTDSNVVEPVQDSSRFFALTVRGAGGAKATVGVGFEERPEAFDLGVALQEARRALGWEGAKRGEMKTESNKDYSLKEGETITVNIGKKTRRREPGGSETGNEAPLQSFALSPPPSAGEDGFAMLPPPPRADDVKRKRRSLKDLGFDDGQFGEFA